MSGKITMRDDLLKLADRCEAADGPNFALEAEIADAVWRAKWGKKRPKDIIAAPYTASLDAALTLVPKGLYPTIDFVKSRVWLRTEDGFDLPNGCSYGFAATPALGICAAAMRAIVAITVYEALK